MKKITVNGKPMRETMTKTGDNFTWNGKQAVITKVVDKEVKYSDRGKFEQFCDEAGIDIDLWNVKQFECGRWDMGIKTKEFDIKKSDLWVVRLILTPRRDLIALKDVATEILNMIKSHSVKYPKLKVTKKREPVLLVLDLPDLHFDKLAWGEETGDDWDIKISSSLFFDMVQDLVDKASVYELDRIVMLVGNDFFNADTLLNTTTAGTPQSVDSRWKKSFIAGKQLMVKTIDLLQSIAQTDVIVIPGNHDKQKSWYLGDTLESWYHRCGNVKVDNSPKGRKYYRYGSNLIGFAHGKDEKPDRLPMIMATEAKEQFSQTKHHEWHLGDRHHRKDIKYMPAQEVDGVMIRYLSSLSPPDNWHYDKGYLAKRAAQAFIYDKENGCVCLFNSFVANKETNFLKRT